MDAESYIRDALAFEPMRKETIREMVRALQLPQGSRGLDAGCGIGLQCLLLAEEAGPAGHVTGLDISAEMLDYGLELIKEAGMTERISFHEGDVARLPFNDDTFDWVWSADCVGYAPWEPLPLLKELARVVKPGGIVAIAAWSSEHLLPGYPQLEARLGATSAGMAPFVQGRSPELHFLRALGWFQALGLKEITAKAFVGSVCAPINTETRKALTALFEMRWPDVAFELSSSDLEEYQRLCLPDSPDFILNLPDYYAFFNYTMFCANVSEPE